MIEPLAILTVIGFALALKAAEIGIAVAILVTFAIVVWGAVRER